MCLTKHNYLRNDFIDIFVNFQISKLFPKIFYINCRCFEILKIKNYYKEENWKINNYDYYYYYVHVFLHDFNIVFVILYFWGLYVYWNYVTRSM